MPYFNMMSELRGCYADNESMQTARFDTRRELKAWIESEARELRNAGAIGLNKRAIASLAAAAWKARKRHGLPYVAPFRYQGQSGWPMGIMVSTSTRADYREWCNAGEW